MTIYSEDNGKNCIVLKNNYIEQVMNGSDEVRDGLQDNVKRVV